MKICAHAKNETTFVIHITWTANGVTQTVEANVPKNQFEEFVRGCIRAVDSVEAIDA